MITPQASVCHAVVSGAEENVGDAGITIVPFQMPYGDSFEEYVIDAFGMTHRKSWKTSVSRKKYSANATFLPGNCRAVL
ncbi:MAG: hypothetical protein PHI31_04060 [Desulfuromonadaceae bacterium]|nr:hypothetical protein [Desulfuromonadaceae bacterium]